jgi:hypothetical protein
MMAFFRSILITIALFAEVHGHQTADVQDSVDDLSSLLQAGMQEKTNAAEGKPQLDTPDATCESLKKDYDSGDRLVSVDDHLVGTHDNLDVVATPALEENDAVAPSAPVTDSEKADPPGAATFKAVLQLMVVALLVDGLRRWRMQQNESSRQQKVVETTADVEADELWAELLTAASLGDEPSFKKIELEKSFVKREDLWGCTALHFAATGGSTEIATDLLQLGAKVDAVDACDETALHFAARSGHVSMCDLLLNNGANVNPLNAQDMTPLVVAGHAKQESACRFLVDHGANAGGMADEHLPPMVVGQVVRKIFEGV